MVIEFHAGTTPYRTSIHTAESGYVDFVFSPQARYAGALAREIGHPFVARELLRRPALFRVYDGPIIEWINEDVRAEGVDWRRLVNWFAIHANDAAVEMMRTTITPKALDESSEDAETVAEVVENIERATESVSVESTESTESTRVRTTPKRGRPRK